MKIDIFDCGCNAVHTASLYRGGHLIVSATNIQRLRNPYDSHAESRVIRRLFHLKGSREEVI